MHTEGNKTEYSWSEATAKIAQSMELAIPSVIALEAFHFEHE